MPVFSRFKLEQCSYCDLKWSQDAKVRVSPKHSCDCGGEHQVCPECFKSLTVLQTVKNPRSGKEYIERSRLLSCPDEYKLALRMMENITGEQR